MIPFLVAAGLVGLIAWVVKPHKATGVTGEMMGYDNARPVPGGLLPAVQDPPPLAPEQTRLLSLLVLFARDKQFGAGEKRFLSPAMALEATRLARAMGLPKTSMAIRKDGPIPNDEYLTNRADSVRKLTVTYGTTGKA